MCGLKGVMTVDNWKSTSQHGEFIYSALLLSTLLLSTLLLSLPLVTEEALFTRWQFKLTELKHLEWFNNRKAFFKDIRSLFGISI